MDRSRVIIDFPGESGERRSWHFADPVEVLVAGEVGEVREVLRGIERAAAEGYYVAGYLSYEAAPAFSERHPVRAGARLPLAWFGVYRAPEDGMSIGAEGHGSSAPTSSYRLSGWEPETNRAEYDGVIAEIGEAIAGGEVDQVNYTIRLVARGEGDDLSFYHRLLAAQGTAYGAYLDLGGWRILSASPELFFRRRGDRLGTRPMKGTARRGRWPEEDDGVAAALVASAKDRGENLITAEWLRGELEALALPGTVEVSGVCEVERYPTVFQLTTSLGARLRAGTTLEEIFAALFPSVSVTGVPKEAAMRRIAELETGPREVYCGAIGVVEPGGDCTFNVPIRTVWIERSSGRAVYGVGGGITGGSTAAGEYDEVLAKSAVLTQEFPVFELIETLRLEEGRYIRLEEHLARLAGSARYFGWADPTEAARAALREHARGREGGRWRVRLLADLGGGVRVESEWFAPETAVADVALARTPVQRDDIFLHHKTTHRVIHEARRAERPELFDVLLWNEEGELTEFTRGNLVVELEGARWTPPRGCGLLGGVYRAELLRRGEIGERVLRVSDLERVTGVWFINSLREWVPVRVIE